MIEAPRKRRGRPRKQIPAPHTPAATVEPRQLEPQKTEPVEQQGDALPANVDEMDRRQMLRYAEAIGMRTPDPAIADGILRANIIHFLHQRIEDAMEIDA